MIKAPPEVQAEWEQQASAYLDAYERELRKFIEDTGKEQKSLINFDDLWNHSPIFDNIRIKYDPSQPRDESGKWTSNGGAAADSMTVGVARPTFSAADNTKAKNQSLVRAAVQAIPASHAQVLKNVPVSLVSQIRQDKHTTESWYDPDKRSIEIAEKTSFTFAKKGWFDRPKTYEIDVKDLQRTTVRELGYAYDHANDWSKNKAIQGELAIGVARLSSTEKRDAAYYVNSSQNSFAELYALAHSPNKAGTYFGNMTRARAEQAFVEALTKVKAMG